MRIFVGYLLFALEIASFLYFFVVGNNVYDEVNFIVAAIGSLAGVILWIWMLTNCIINYKKIKNSKTWFIFLIIANWITGLIYFIVVYRNLNEKQ
jgi:uncharacterized membrane protein